METNKNKLRKIIKKSKQIQRKQRVEFYNGTSQEYLQTVPYKAMMEELRQRNKRWFFHQEGNIVYINETLFVIHL